MTSDIVVEQTGRTVTITLDRPTSRNALTLGLVKELRAAIESAGAQPDVRCVVITGAGGHFCAGADLKRTMQEDPQILERLDQYLDAYNALTMAIVRCPRPTIAMIDGAAVGFGADMALACDLRTASTDAYLQEKFVNIGLMPDGGGTFWLPRLVGTARAMKAFLLSEKLGASALEELGLLAAIAPAESLRAVTMDLAAKLEKGPPLAIAAIKQAVVASLGDLEAALKREREGQLQLLRSRDFMEGVLAFATKREPLFQGE